MDGHLHTMDQQGLGEFIATREGLLNIIEQLRGGAKKRWSFSRVKSVVEEVFNHYLVDRYDGRGGVYRPYLLQVNPELTWCRVGNLEEGRHFCKASDLGAPPKDKTKSYGRCHEPGAPVCYCALYEDIALAEVNAEVGKRYAIATYELMEDLNVVPVGEFDFFRRTGGLYLGGANPKDLEHYKQVLSRPGARLLEFVDAFFAEEFISPASCDTDYKLTAALATKLLSYPKHSIDAIFYPSVAFRAGFNLAIRPEAVEKKMRLVPGQTRIVYVTEAIGYGIFETEDECILQAFGTDGTLQWK